MTIKTNVQTQNGTELVENESNYGPLGQKHIVDSISIFRQVGCSIANM